MIVVVRVLESLKKLTDDSTTRNSDSPIDWANCIRALDTHTNITMATVNSPYAKSGILSDDDVLQGLQALLTASLAVSGPTSSADSVMTASLLGSNLGSPSNGGLSRSSVDMALLSHAPLSHTQPQGIARDPSVLRMSIYSVPTCIT